MAIIEYVSATQSRARNVLAEMNKRVTLQKPVKTPNSQGGFAITWSDEDTIWAAIWPVSAKSITQDAQIVKEMTHRIRIHFRRNVRVSKRLKYKNRYFNIVSIINPNEENEWLDILCKEASA